MKDGRDAEEQAGDKTDGEREEEDPGVDGCGVGLLAGIGAGDEADERCGDKGGEREAGGAAGDSEESTFDEQLRDDAAAACAECIAHGHFARAAGGAEQKKRGDIDCAHGDEETGHAHENHERRFQVHASGREAG